MELVDITTANTREGTEIFRELQDPDSSAGPSIAVWCGRAGRGKTHLARKCALHFEGLYVRTLPVMTPTMLLREICFELSTLRPRTTESCLEVIREEMGRKRRVFLIDEADLLPMRALETLRGLNELTGAPLILIGEEELKSKIASRRRIVSRVRRSLTFAPVTQADLVLYYARALGVDLSPKVAAILYRSCGGDWRPLIKAALDVERAMKASGLSQVTESLAKEVTQ
jgi:DNA transposition AAA+ family ATPase